MQPLQARRQDGLLVDGGHRRGPSTGIPGVHTITLTLTPIGAL